MLRRWRLDRKALLLLALALAVVLASVALYVLKLRAEASWERDQEQVQGAQRVLAQARQVDLDALRAEREQTRAEVERTTFPPAAKSAEMTGLLTRWVRESQVQLKGISLTPGMETVGKNSYSANYHQLQARGGAPELLALLRSFESSGLLTLVVNKVTVSPKEGAWEATIYAILYTRPP